MASYWTGSVAYWLRWAECWGLPIPEGRAPKQKGTRWSVLHDLAYIYLVLAHATDHDLSAREKQVILDKLREWEPSTADVRATLDAALARYAEGGR